MGAEFIPVMGDGTGAMYTVEHDTVRLMAGEVETLRGRLSEALEHLGYRIMNESPLHARRIAQGWGGELSSNNILDCRCNLQVGLKQTAPQNARVTFAYSITATQLLQTDRVTLEKEVDAIVALAGAQAGARHCPACGSEIVAGSRFCRQCGTPRSHKPPAEVEIMKLTANAGAAYKGISIGTIFMLIGIALALLIFLFDPESAKFFKKAVLFGGMGGFFGLTGLTMILFGLRNLGKIFQPVTETEREVFPAMREQPALEAPTTDSLRLPPPSITEATTEMFEKSRSDRKVQSP